MEERETEEEREERDREKERKKRETDRQIDGQRPTGRRRRNNIEGNECQSVFHG